MERILYISYDGLTDPLGQSQIIPYLQGLSKQGYQFTILSFEKKERFKRDEDKIRGLLNPYQIQWHPLSFSTKPPVLSKMFDVIRMKSKAYSLHKEKHFDMIHCRSYLAADVGVSIKKKFSTKFFFDMRGFWADEKVDNGQWNQKNFIFRVIYRRYKKKEQRFLLNADATISLTEAAKNEILKDQLYKNILVDVIPCCADLDLFNYGNIENETVAELRKQLKIPAGKKIISYLGSVGGWYMTKEMFAFYKRLLKKYPEFTMLFLTKDDPSRVMYDADSANIPRENIIVRYAERNILPTYLSLSNCSIFFIRPTFSKIATSPTKHGELMGMGIPVICNDIGDTGKIINKTNSGFVVDDFSDEAYDKAISQIPKLLSLDKKTIRQAAFEYFDLKKGVAKYNEVYKRVLSN